MTGTSTAAAQRAGRLAALSLVIVTALWGPIIMTGFEAGAYITATMFSVERYTRKSSRGRAIHTQVLKRPLVVEKERVNFSPGDA